MIQRLCMNCRTWHDRRDEECPECGDTKSGFNKSLRMGELNNSLFAMAEKAERERQLFPT